MQLVWAKYLWKPLMLASYIPPEFLQFKDTITRTEDKRPTHSNIMANVIINAWRISSSKALRCLQVVVIGVTAVPTIFIYAD
jgi:hypothetical protein